MFMHLSADSVFRAAEAGPEFLQELLQLIGAKNQPEEIAQVIDIIRRSDAQDFSITSLRSLGEGLQRAGVSLRSIGLVPAVRQVLSRALTASGDVKATEATRLDAIRLLALTSYAESANALLPLLMDQSLPIQLAAIGALARFPEAQIAPELVQRWASFKPQARSAALAALLARPDRVGILLKAIEDGEIPPSELTTSQIKFLRNHRDSEVRQLALKILGAANANPRQQVVDAFQDALRLKGDAAHGKDIYLQRCVSCHRLDGQGFVLGPDLVTVKNAGNEKTLANILDPSREVAPQYIAFEIETTDGESSIGIIASETTSAITVLQAYGKSEVIPRTNIKRMRSLGQSLMPEGLEQGLSPQDLANLLQYIASAGR
jgi:putative heme-binding domain-containing protein